MDFLKNYRPPKPKIWQGRADEAGARIFQLMQCHDLTQRMPEKAQQAYALVGFACDAGVKRNLGREGAAAGPQTLRQALANLPVYQKLKQHQLYDFGDITCQDDDLESAQNALAELIALLRNQGYQTIVLGGGHEVAWGHYQGLSANNSKPINIINFDAHYDLRPLLINNQGSSGTPFLQIAKHCQAQQQAFHYHCFGIQASANTESLAFTAKELGVDVFYADDFMDINKLQQALDHVINSSQQIYLTLCLDVFAASHCPGVSAPQALGLLPQQIQPLFKQISSSKKVIGFDIAELAPNYDIDNKSARLGAYFIWEYLHA